MGGDRLGPYLCDLHRDWLAREPQVRLREQDASLLFFDISGFTPLTERLAKRGKAGVEQLIDTLNGVVAPLVDTASTLGGDTLKFGGDALLLLFAGDEHERRACAAAHDMQAAMQPLRRMRTQAGIVSLRASAAVASGPVHLFLAGDRFRELIVAGPTTSEVMGLERDAGAGEVLLGPSTCARLEPACRAAAGDRGDGVTLLAARPDVEHVAQPPPALDDPVRGLPAALHDHLGPAAESEHRQVTVAFAQFRGLDELLSRAGAAAAAEELHALIARAQDACHEHGVTFLATDADRAAGKVFAVAGAPTASTDDEDRMLLALREIVAHEGALRVRAGVNRGRAFAVHLGAPQRRTYTTMGDTTNLAARVMGRAPDGQVLATRAVLDHARAPFALAPIAPFSVKGKRALVEAQIVGAPRAVAPRAAVDSPLAGRASELRVLRAALEAARAGDGQVVELVAEPGMGKSRLLAEVIAELAGSDLRQVVVEAGAHGTSTPYLALRGPLRRLLAGDGARDGELAAALARLVREHIPASEPLLPLVAIPFGLQLAATAESARLSSDAGRAQLHFHVEQLLAALLPPHRTLLLIEDAHWLDEASSDLLRAVLQRAGERGWAVFVTLRGTRGGLEDLPQTRTRVELAPLAAEAARALVVAAGEGALAPHVTAALVERSQGKPVVPERADRGRARRRRARRAARHGRGSADGADRHAHAIRSPPAAARGGARPALSDLLAARHARRVRDRARRCARAARRVRRDAVRARALPPRVAARGRLRGAAVRAPPRAARACRRADRARAGRRRRRLRRHPGAAFPARAGVRARLELRPRGRRAGARPLRARRRRAAVPPRAGGRARAEARAAGDERGLRGARRRPRLLWGARARARGVHARAGSSATTGCARPSSCTAMRAPRWTAARSCARRAGCCAACACSTASTRARARPAARRCCPSSPACACGSAATARRSRCAGRRSATPSGRRRRRRSRTPATCSTGRSSRMGVPVRPSTRSARWRSTGATATPTARRRCSTTSACSPTTRAAGTTPSRCTATAARPARARATSTARRSATSTMGEVRSDQGRAEEARTLLERALEIWRGTGHQLGVAYAIALLGRLHARAGSSDAALELLADALVRYRELRLSADALWVEALVAEAQRLCRPLGGGARRGAAAARGRAGGAARAAAAARARRRARAARARGRGG